MGFKKDRKIEKYEKDRGRRGEEIRKELERWERVRGDGTLIEGGGHWQRGGDNDNRGERDTNEKGGGTYRGGGTLTEGGRKNIKRGGKAVPKYVNPRTWRLLSSPA